MARPSGNDLLIATSLSGGESLMLKKEQRSRHLYVTGSTGSGELAKGRRVRPSP